MNQKKKHGDIQNDMAEEIHITYHKNKLCINSTKKEKKTKEENKNKGRV